MESEDSIMKKEFGSILNKAVEYYNNKSYEDVIKTLDEHIYSDVVGDFFLTLAYFQLQKFEKCTEIGRKIKFEELNNIDSFVELQTKIALANINLNRLDDAIKCMEKLGEIKRGVTNIYYDIGKKYYEIGKENYTTEHIEDAIHCYKKELEINQNFYTVYNSLGCCYWRINELELSRAHFKKCLEMEPGHNEARKNLAVSYFDLKQYDKSKKYFKESLKYEPNNSIILYAMSNLYLKLKNLEKGLTMYEHRFYKNMKKDMHSCIPKISGVKLWDEVTECNNLLVIWEQGLGDMVQFYRYVLLLKERLKKTTIHYMVPKNLVHLFKEYTGIKVIGSFDNSITYEYYIYLMSIPKILEITSIDEFNTNYIDVNKDKIEYWKNELKPLKKLRVGLFWRGNNVTKIQKHIPLSLFKDMLGLDIDFIALQKGKGEEEVTKIDNINYYTIDEDLAFSDTIAILSNIDLLITVDTSIVHLAGIMGVKTWLILGYISEWRWFLDEKKTDWYSNVELFRNNDIHSWKPVLNDIKDALQERYLKDK